MMTENWFKQTKPNELKYICIDCAIEMNCTWPEGQVSTFHTGECEKCSQAKTLCDIKNWNKISNKKNNKIFDLFDNEASGRHVRKREV